MLFDRYEIQIQALVGFINGKLINVQLSFPSKYVQNMYSYFQKKMNKLEKQKTKKLDWVDAQRFNRFHLKKDSNRLFSLF